MATYRWIARSVVLTLALTARGLADPPPNKASTGLTVATYNVRNMLDAHDDPHSLDEERPPKKHRQIKQIAKTIRRLNADVVAIQEIENTAILDTMIHNHLKGLGYRYVLVQPTNSRYGLNLGLISRKPILSVTSHRLMDLPMPANGPHRKFARDLLHAQIQVTQQKILDLFVAHFKSRHDSPDDPKSAKWRLAEADATRRVIERTAADRGHDAWILVAGDLNATPGSPPFELLLRSDEGRRPLLVDLHAHLPSVKRVTYRFKPYRDTIDYLMASPALAKRVVPQSTRVLTDSKLLAGSDHAPVVAGFDTAP